MLSEPIHYGAGLISTLCGSTVAPRRETGEVGRVTCPECRKALHKRKPK